MNFYLIANSSNLSRYVALRQQQELEACHERNAGMLGVGLGMLALMVVVSIIVVIANAISGKASAAEQLAPPNAAEEHNIAVKSKNTQSTDDVPSVMVYEDNQYPVYENYEAQYGNVMLQLIDEGKITLEVRIVYFLDDQTEQAPNKKSPQRAAMVTATADAADKYREYHKVTYESQLREGIGYIDQQSRVGFVAKAGITRDDLTIFQKLHDTKAYADFARNSHGAMGKAGTGGTPTHVVNGKKINFGNLPPDDLQTALTATQSAAPGSN